MSDESGQKQLPHPGATDAAETPERQFTRRLGWIFLSATLMLCAGAGAYLLHQQQAARREASQELSAIADLKLHEINNWRAERLADAHFFSNARFAAQDMQRFLQHPDAETRAAVAGWLSLLQGDDRYYAVRVYDAKFERRLAIPEATLPPSPEVLQSLEAVSRKGSLELSDLRRDPETGRICMDLLFPLFADPNVRTGPPMAIVLLKLDAKRFLFPLVQSWPTPSESAETLLVRREGDYAVYLNDLRHRPGSALALRLPLSEFNLPASRILRGETRVLEGVDYRGVPVVAAGRIVAGTGWGMVAKVDRSELYQPLRRELGVAWFFLAALLLAGGLMILLVWRQRSAHFLRQQLALERERAALADQLTTVMREANVRLEAMVEEKTQALREANTNLETFAYSAAHDLRSPLRYVKGFATLLLDEYGPKLGPDAAVLLERLNHSVDRMATLVNDLLEYSRISQADLKPEPVHLQDTLREVLDFQAGEILSREATVTVEGDLPTVVGHPATVALLVNNLVANALKFVAPGVHPRVRISAEHSDSRVRVWVEDNGLGIAREDQERIFAPFERLHSRQTYPGTGLGLAMVRKAVQRMGGHVGVQSELGKGSRFWIELPAA